MTQRSTVLLKVAEEILAVALGNQVTKVAVDGVDGAGKSVFASELAEVLRTQGKIVIQSSVDFFHNPKAVRYRLGSSSPQGFYADSYNYSILKEVLLEPLSLGGNYHYHVAAFDHKTDTALNTPQELANLGSILVFDGIFLHRSELRSYWDYSIFLEVAFETSIPRGNQRFGASLDPKDESNRRYVEGQKIYLNESKPKKHASIIINNENLSSPYIVS